MAMPDVPIIPSDGTTVITDGTTPTPLSHTIQYEDGDESFGPFRQGNKEYQVFRDRGQEYSARQTEDVDFRFTWTCHAVATTDASLPNILDIARWAGSWASAVSTLSTTGSRGDVKTVQIAWTAERSNFGGSADAVLTLKYCIVSNESFSQGIPGKWSIDAKVMIPQHDRNNAIAVA